MKAVDIYVGYDPNQDIAYKVCERSIYMHNTGSISVKKINSDTITGYERKYDPLASTPFTYARFYIPYINDYQGASIFCDGDFLFLDNVQNLWNLFDSRYAVQVVKHDYTPTSTIKMDNKIQTIYPKKNWSSLIIWNNEHPKNKQLNLNVLNNASGSFLHQFQWLEESEIGELSHEWNWLVGWYKETNQFLSPKALHFTEGGPWLKHSNDSYDRVWLDYKSLFGL